MGSSHGDCGKRPAFDSVLCTRASDALAAIAERVARLPADWVPENLPPAYRPSWPNSPSQITDGPSAYSDTCPNTTHAPPADHQQHDPERPLRPARRHAQHVPALLLGGDVVLIRLLTKETGLPLVHALPSFAGPSTQHPARPLEAAPNARPNAVLTRLS